MKPRSCMTRNCLSGALPESAILCFWLSGELSPRLIQTALLHPINLVYLQTPARALWSKEEKKKRRQSLLYLMWCLDTFHICPIITLRLSVLKFTKFRLSAVIIWPCSRITTNPYNLVCRKSYSIFTSFQFVLVKKLRQLFSRFVKAPPIGTVYHIDLKRKKKKKNYIFVLFCLTQMFQYVCSTY